MAREMGSISLDDILITDQLSRRAPKASNLQAENAALRTLARQLVEQPQIILTTLVSLAKNLCEAGTAGVSLLETTPSGEEIFRWVAIVGDLANYEQGVVLRRFSPCGVCLERQAPQLYSYPARHFTYLQSIEPAVVEALVLHLIAAQPLGAIWILSHDPQRQFDAEDVRLMTSLADFTAAALHNKQIEQNLRQREAELRLVTNTVPVLISFVDSEQRYRFNNRPYEEWFGQPAHEIYGKTLWEVMGNAAYQMIRPYVEQVLAGQQVTFESKIPFPETAGGTRIVSATYIPRLAPTGSVEGFVALVNDISARTQAETALRQSEERLRIAQQAAKAGVWNWDIVANQVTWSQEYYSLYGLDPATTQPSYDNWLACIVEPDREHVNRIAREALERQINLNVEFRILHPTHGERWITAIGQTFYDANQQPIRMTGIALDITERKQAEVALSQSEFRYQTLVTNIPGMVYRYFPDADFKATLGGRFIYVSSGSRDLFELEPETILQDANALWSLIHPDDLPDLQTSVAIAVEQRAFWQWEGRLMTPSGQVKWIQGKARMEATEYGNVWDGLLVDISHRKQAEDALAQSEAQLRLIIESAKDYAIFTLDMNSRVTRWNSGAQRLLGYQEQEIIGQNGRIIFTPEDLERGEADQELQKALSNGRAENERWHVRKDGSRFWGSGLMMPLRDEDNQIQGFLKIMQDKTTQRQADERLHLLYETTSNLLATEQPLALMTALFSKLSTSLDLHCYYNFLIEEKDGQPKLHLRTYSGIAEDLAAQIEWLDLGQYIGGWVAQERQQMVLNQAEIAAHPQAQFIRAMGISAYACQPLIARGRLLGTLSFASFTRTRFTPEEVNLLEATCAQIAIAIERANLTTSLQQQAEQLQQASRIKDEFLAVLSHELRSPLNPILGWAKLLQGRKLSEAKTVKALATIERNAKLQAELIEDLLDVSRILQGKLSLNMAPVDLTSTIQAAMETVRLAAEAKAIQIQTTLDPAVGKILGDSARIQQVIWNLLSNAVKFTPAGGRVEIRLERIKYERGDSWMNEQQRQSAHRSLNSYVQIRVTDTGQGIEPEFLPYVFDTFRQADGAITRQFGGLGLGLAIARHIVELHGGIIAVASPGEGKGATFVVRLPLLGSNGSEQEQEQAVASDTTPLHPLTGLSILVVDDESDSREFFAFVLEQAGADVISVASAAEALHTLSQVQPQVLLSDIGMPGVDGYRLIQQIRTLSPKQGGTIAAIALTAYAGELDQQQALAAGFQQHLAKPVEPEALVQAILSLNLPLAPQSRSS